MRLRFDKERHLYFLMCGYIFLLPIMDMLSNILLICNISFVHKDLVQYGTLFILIVLISISIRRVNARMIGKLLISTLATVMLFAFSAFQTPEVKPIIIHSYLTFFVLVLNTAFLVYQVNDFKKFIHTIERFYPMLIVYAISVLLVKNKLLHGYSMNFSYNSFIVSSTALLVGILEKKIWKIMIFFLTVLTNLIAGSRGALFCDVILFALIFVFYFGKDCNPSRIIMAFMTIIAGAVFVSFVPMIARVLYQKFPSRTLEMIANGRISRLTGREEFYPKFWMEIVEHPFKIRGVLADRAYMAQLRGVSVSVNNLTEYAHNFFLEVLFQFGFVLGIILVVFTIYKVARFLTLLIKKQEYYPFFTIYYIMAVAYAFGQLMFSNSYLVSTSMGLLVACILSAGKIRRNYEVEI